ncbi:MAG: V-type ATP synthase subunit F [Candidatus Thorarchaeota archaeon]
MVEQKIFVLGDDETVTMLGLIGIDGIALEDTGDFLKEFNRLVNDTSISMIIIVLDLPDDIIEFLIDYKLNKRRPFIFYIPDIFNLQEEFKDRILNNVYGAFNKLIS